MVPYSSPAIVITDFRIETEESECRRASCGADDILFLSVGRHPKHTDRDRAAVVANVSFVDVELDRGRCREGAAAVLLILDFVMVAFRLEHTVTHESAGIRQ
jgi:hypothetical protein